MVADKGKKVKVSAAEKFEEENSEQLDGELVLSIEKLQEIQDELEKVIRRSFCMPSSILEGIRPRPTELSNIQNSGSSFRPTCCAILFWPYEKKSLDFQKNCEYMYV